MIAWHYTVGLKLPLICESGVLRPTDVCIGPGERPVLWFLAQRRLRFECNQVGKDCVVGFFARYCRDPQAFDLGVELARP